MKNRLFLGLLCLLPLSVVAQVTIGSTELPVPGAILDLKENSNLGSNATKGLGFSRVNLVSRFQLDPCVELATDEQKNAHKGLIVYNMTDKALEPVNACEPVPDWDNFIEKGLHVWDGDQWGALEGVDYDSKTTPPGWASEDVKYLIDKDNNRYPVRKFGDAGVWMLENLRVTSPVENYRNVAIDIYGCCEAQSGSMSKYRYSFPSPPDAAGVYPTSSDDTFFKKYPNIGLRYSADLAFYGELPTFDAAGNVTKHVQGICPVGWHIPTLIEFRLVISEISRLANAGLYDEAGVVPSQMTGVDSQRWSATRCLPNDIVEDTSFRGASQTPYKGGFAILWAGANSPMPGSKEYGTLAVFWLVNDPISGNVSSNPYRNIYLRPSYTSWLTDQQALPSTLQYSVRCKKDNDNMSDLE